MEDIYKHIKKQDLAVYKTIVGEKKRQAAEVQLIPSENIVSRAVEEALGSVFTNKYSEGYPGKRYYGGQKYTDEVELLAIERAKKLFGADHANVQPLGGANANIAVYQAWLEPHDTVLGMDLAHGGHLTHGSPATYVGKKMFNFVRYKMKDPDTGEIDYDEVEAIALREKPKLIIGGFSAYTRELDWQRLAEIANKVGAVAMADVAHIAGLIVGGAAKNPFDYGFHVVTTTTHKTLRGPRGGLILSRGIVSSTLKAPEKTIENLPTLIDRSVFPGLQGGPHMHQIAGKAVAFGEALKPSFKTYAKQIVKNAKVMEKVFKANNIRLQCGGTDNHMLLADVRSSLGIGGKDAEALLESVGITLNKNAIVGDEKMFDPSGIRFGTPAITTRKFKEKESARVAELMVETLKNPADQKKLKAVHAEIKALCKKFPIPESFV